MKPKTQPDRHPPGIAPYRDQWRVYVRVRGVYRSKLLPEDATPEELRDAREELRVDLRRELKQEPAAPIAPDKPEAEPFSAAAARYLPAVRSMTTYDERERDIGLWVAEFGDRPIGRIGQVDVRTVLERWFLYGPRMVQVRSQDPRVHGRRRATTWTAVPGPLSASTVNHRKRALANLFTVLFGRGAANPARQVADYSEPDAPPRAIPRPLIDLILAAIPDRGSSKKAGEARPTFSFAKAFLGALAWTTLTPAQLNALQAADVDRKTRTVMVTRRRKGKGVSAHRRPLTARGLEALKAVFIAKAAGGRYTKSSIRRVWRTACAAVQKALGKKAPKDVDLMQLRPYDLRHTMAAETLAATGDLDATRALMGHADIRTTEGYAKAQVPAWLQEAAAKVEARQGRTPKARKPGRKLHRKLRMRRNTNNTHT